MSAGLSLISNLDPQQATTPPLASAPSSAGERMTAAWQGSQTEDRYWNLGQARKERAQNIIDDLHGLTGERLRNPFDNAPTIEEVRENLGQPTTVIYAKRLEALKQKAAEAKASLPSLGGLPDDFLDVDSIDKAIAASSVQAREQAGNLVGTGGGIPAFLAGSAAEMASPHGVASMFLPVSRLPTAAAEAVGGAWLRSMGKEALVQAAGQAAVQIPAELIDYYSREPLGTAPTTEEMLGNVASTAAGGAIFGAAFRGIHLGVRRMLDVPPAVRDAAVVMESGDLYGDKNQFGFPAAAHEKALDGAVEDLARGRPVDIATIANEIPLHPLQQEAQTLRTAINDFEAQTRSELDTLNAELYAQPRTGTEITDYMGRIRRLEGALSDYEAFRGGTGPEPEMLASYRAQLRVIDEEMRDAKVGRYFQTQEQATELKGLQKVVDEPSIAPKLPPDEEIGAGRPEVNPADQSLDAHVKALLEEGGGATPEHRAQYEKATQEEKEAGIAVGCVGGAI